MVQMTLEHSGLPVWLVRVLVREWIDLVARPRILDAPMGEVRVQARANTAQWRLPVS